MNESSGIWPALMKRHHCRQLPLRAEPYAPRLAPAAGRAVRSTTGACGVWRHLDRMQYRTPMRAEPSRVSCAEHGVWPLPVPWATKDLAMRLWGYRARCWAHRMWTHRYAWAIRSLLEPSKNVARATTQYRDRVINVALTCVTHAQSEGTNAKDPMDHALGLRVSQPDATPPSHLHPSAMARATSMPRLPPRIPESPLLSI